MISNVRGFLSTPSWWMPEWCAKALAPTTALLGWTSIPVSCETSREVRYSCEWSSCVVTPYTSGCSHVAIATSSSAALPARSPMPLTQVSICRAPPSTLTSELAVARPRSLWQWTESTTVRSLGTCSYIQAMSERHSSGVAYPTVSGRLIVVAPASMQLLTTSARYSRSVRLAFIRASSTSYRDVY